MPARLQVWVNHADTRYVPSVLVLTLEIHLSIFDMQFDFYIRGVASATIQHSRSMRPVMADTASKLRLLIFNSLQLRTSCTHVRR